jgi:antitoxin component YwqK of YwqJK toxin-antitoxin module
MKIKKFDLFLGLSLIGLLVWVFFSVFGYLPGSIRKEPDGSHSGTGPVVFRYPNGAVKLEDHYQAGRLKRSVWFRPDGGIVAETIWKNGDGDWYQLREDGTIRTKMEMRNQKAHGTAIYYKEDGKTADRMAEFRNGVKVEN